MHEAESLSVITHGLFSRCWYTDIQRCTISDSKRELMETFIQICQEGKIMRTLIGMIHSSAEHNKQLCFHIWVRLGSSAAATVHSCFSLPVRFWRLRRDMKMFLLFRHVALACWLLCSLAACHPTNYCQRNCVMPYSVWCVDGGNNLFLLIALWHEFEWLSGQLKNRFAVKTEILWISLLIYNGTRSPAGLTAACKLRIAHYLGSARLGLV